MTTLNIIYLAWTSRLTTLFSSAGKWLAAFICGTLWTLIEPVASIIGVCIFAMVADTVSAWRLNRRCRIKYPQYTDGKLHSNKIRLLIHDLFILVLTIYLSYLIDCVVLVQIETLYLPNWIAAIYCCYQVISIIENESSCSDSSWAKLAQKVVANKIARHLDLEPDQVEELLRPHKSTTAPEASATVPNACPSGSTTVPDASPSGSTSPSASPASPSPQ